MKKIILTLVICLMSFNANAFSKIDDKQIILLTGLERQDVEDYETLADTRARNVCSLIGKELQSYTYEEIRVGNRELYNNYTIPQKGFLKTPPPGSLKEHIHDGGAVVTVLTLGLVPIIISYKTRVITDITCTERNDDKQYTTE